MPSLMTRIVVACLAMVLPGSACLAATPYSTTIPIVTSASASSAPIATVSVLVPGVTASGTGTLKLVGGGARTNYSGFGSLLTQSYPSSPTSWTAVAKDHLSADPATITAYVVGINDPTDDWDVGIFQSQPSAVANHPSASASLPAGYVLTGGGCVDNWVPTGAMGNLLTASYPTLPPPPAPPTWECRGKDHSVASPASLVAYVIGIRPKRAGIPMPSVQITTATSAAADLPEVVAAAVPGAIVTGGGAAAAPTDPSGWGQLLTGTYPEINAAGAVVGWHARSKDHAVVSPGTVTAYAINLTVPVAAAPTGAAVPPTGPTLSPTPVPLTLIAPNTFANYSAVPVVVTAVGTDPDVSFIDYLKLLPSTTCVVSVAVPPGGTCQVQVSAGRPLCKTDNYTFRTYVTTSQGTTYGQYSSQTSTVLICP